MDDLRILIADDHELIRRGIRDLLAPRKGWQIVAEARNGLEAVEKASRYKPHIAILDFSMPALNGEGAAARIHKTVPDTRVIVLTMHDSEQVIREVLQSGARGMVFKNDADRDLLMAIEMVSEGRYFFATRVSEMVLNGYMSKNSTTRTKGPVTLLTTREREVMRLLADGMTSKEVAMQLKISTRTVESHRININRKLGFGSIADLVRYAIRNEILSHT
jgi:DNA-binding NarL/FixJ family response regulator